MLFFASLRLCVRSWLCEHKSRIDCTAALGVDDERVDVHFTEQTIAVECELADPYQHISDGVEVGGWLAAHTGEYLVTGEGAQQLARAAGCERWDGKRYLVQYLSQHASHADEHDRPELRILLDTDD